MGSTKKGKEPGALAVLILRGRRGLASDGMKKVRKALTLREVARQANCSPSAAMYLEKGWQGETRYLGVHDERILIRVAKVLGLDRDAVASALLTDLGWPPQKEGESK